MGSFFDGFADSLTSSFSAVTQRKSEKERTALGYDTLDEEKRKTDLEDKLARDRLAIDQGTLDINREKWTEEKADLPDVREARKAETERARQESLLTAEKVTRAKWENDPKQQELELEKTRADIESLRAGGRLNDAEANKLIAELPYAGARIKAEIDSSNATTEHTQAETAAINLGLMADKIGAKNLWSQQRGEEVTWPMMNYYAEHGYFPGEGPDEAVPAEEAIPTLADPDPDDLDEPAPGENPDEPYVGDGPLTDAANAPIPAPMSGAPLTADRAPTDTEPVLRSPSEPAGTPPPRTEGEGLLRGEAGEAAATPARTLEDYERMTDSQFFALSKEERQRYDQLKAESPRPVVPHGTAGTALLDSDSGKPLSSWNSSGAGEAARIPQPRPNRPEAALPIGTRGVERASFTPGVEHAGARIDKPNIGRAHGQGRVIEAQSGTRKLPLNDRTRTMMEQASAQTGLTVKVTSGAQESSGPNRTGSHRHDSDVGAGDIQLIDEATGKPVSMRTPEGREKILQYMRAARDAGATGFGAGLDYMGEHTIHVGFGDPGVWGAGGKGANAPKWLKDGMNAGAGPSSQPQGTGSRPAGVARAYQILQQNDMPQMQAAVLAGNIQQESSGDPNAFNEKEGAKGVIQWRQDRLAKLEQFAADNGGDANSLETQLEFLVQEGESLGSGQDKAAWQEFMTATTPEAANAALKKFIRYGDESAGTRLEYANNLLRSGGAEIVGEKGTSQRVAPRGESERKDIIRANIVKGAMEGSRAGMKGAVQQAGLMGRAAVPDQNRQQAQRDFLTGDTSGGKALARIQEVTQKSFKPGDKFSQAELNLATLNYAYEFASRHGDEAKTQAAMGALYQAFKPHINKRMAFAKQLLTQGRTDEAMQMLAQAQAYLNDGTETTVEKDGDGYLLTVADVGTKDIVHQQSYTKEEAEAYVMSWSPADIERQMLRAMGRTPPSAGFEAAQAELNAAGPAEPPETSAGDFTRRAIPMLETPDTSEAAGFSLAEQPTEAERDDIQKLKDEGNAIRTKANEAAQPPTAVARGDIRAELEAFETVRGEGLTLSGEPKPGSLAESMKLLRDTYGNDLVSIVTETLQTNPSKLTEDIVRDLGRMLANSDPAGGTNNMPMRASRGDYEGTWKVEFLGSPTKYNIPEATAETIRTGLMNKMQAEQEKFGGEFQTHVREAPSKAREAFDKQAAEAANAARERYTPGALQRPAGVKQGALPYDQPPAWAQPGWRPTPTPYSEPPPQRRF